MHLKTVFYCSTLSAPISRCINVLGIRQREMRLKNIFYVPFPPLNFPLGRMRNENTPKFATKNKTPLLGKKLLVPLSPHYARKAEIVEKKMATGSALCLLNGQRFIIIVHPNSFLNDFANRQSLVCLNAATNNFHKLPTSPTLWEDYFNCRNYDDEQMVGEERRKT